MNLFTFSFEESEYIVDEAFIKRAMEKSNNKRFIGSFFISFLIYCYMTFLPIILGIQTIQQYHFINYPLLIVIGIFYLGYIIFSVRYHQRNIYKKFFSSCYFVISFFILLFLGSVAILFLIYQKQPFIAILDFILTAGFIINSQFKLFQGIKSSIQKQKQFKSMSYILSERVSRILLIVGGSGVTAIATIINIQTDGRSNEIIDSILEVFFPLLLYLIFYFLFVEFYKGYYVIKYFEPYRVKFGYSIEDWYGKNSKEYKESLNN